MKQRSGVEMGYYGIIHLKQQPQAVTLACQFLL